MNIVSAIREDFTWDIARDMHGVAIGYIRVKCLGGDNTGIIYVDILEYILYTNYIQTKLIAQCTVNSI